MSESADIRARIGAGRKRHRGRGWLILALILAAGGGWWWVAARTRADPVLYLTEPAATLDLIVTVTATGTVQPTTEVVISSELSGTLAAVGVDFNDVVTVGQELARLDTQRLTAARANAAAALAAAQARLDQAATSMAEAQAGYASQQELDQRGVTTRRDLSAAEAGFQRSVAALAIAQADLALARSNLDLAEADLAKAVIRSPIRGIVLDRTAEVGQIVGASLASGTLFTLAEDLTRMELQLNVDEADIGRVVAGQAASFTVDAFGSRSFPAEVTQVRYSPQTTEGVVTYTAVLSVANADLLLRPGMTATATITVAQMAGALVVPNGALRFAPPQISDDQGGAGLIGLILPDRRADAGAGSGRSVWVLRVGQPVEVAVETGDTDGQVTAITGGDLAAGDAVITDLAQDG